MKLGPLVAANLKGFLRKPRNIFLLVVFPLLLISVIFLAFNPTGLRVVDVGYTVGPGVPFDDLALRETLGGFSRLTAYAKLDDCLVELHQAKEYVCINAHDTSPIVLDVFYDNTREPVIWEIIERIKQSAQYVQKEESREIAGDFLTKFTAALNKLNSFDKALQITNSDLQKGVTQIDNSRSQLEVARGDLVVTLNQMDQDIAQARTETAEARSTKNSYASDAYGALNALNTPIASLYGVAGAQSYAQQINDERNKVYNKIAAMDSAVETKLYTIDQRLSSYDQRSVQGRSQVQNIDSGIAQLQTARSSLSSYQAQIGSTRGELTKIQGDFDELQDLDAETLVNPVVIYNLPVYVPDIGFDLRRELTPEDAARGQSLIALQTMFPMVLLLISLFLALLIGSFVALNEVNARTSIRMRLIKNMFFPEFLSTIISAIIIVSVPILVVLLIGTVLFRLPILPVIAPLFILLALVTLYFILLGVLLAYLVRKESITLMVSTFILVLLIFLSGFLLPIERMSPLFALIAYLNPGSIAVAVFKQLVFYDVSMSALSFSYWWLTGEVVLLLLVTLIVRKIRR